MQLTIEILNKSHKKQEFDCGISMLNNYIRQQAKQDVKRDLSACFVLVEQSNSRVIGYYTLSSNSIPRADFPDLLIKRLPPSYTNLPTILLGRLAIDKEYKGNGFGELILMDALNRSVNIAKDLGTLAVVVDPVDKNARYFYERYGFMELTGSGKMFLPIKTIQQLAFN